ncbi:ATP-binding protein [Clostridium sp. BJN0001]|uniref:ATP-binding protein n=1 Tax=Clostridium sp. BJN0001 TaxID=2930219 RepID=UPI001FD2CBD7|nr:ATP-binding protein [Clostridium sp. BJN0001]
MIKGYQAEIMKIYQTIRDNEDKKQKERRNEIKKKYPEIIEIENKISKLSLNMAIDILKSKDKNNIIENYKNKMTDLKMKKCELLVSKGYDSDYLNHHYDCPKCKDTGFIGTDKCSCYKEKLIRLYYKNSELQNIISDKNFDTFDINLFSTHRNENEKYSPRKNMENNLDYIMKSYIPDFNNITTNLLFYGNPGSGKTFLSYCIAETLLNAGYLVVYRTSEELIDNLRDVRFNNDNNIEELLLDCDLLIIDDLGSEHLNEFSVSELFSFLNKKILTNKKMLISTNLTLPEIVKNYSERISSRLIGDFKLCKFYSDDIRIKKNLNNR